MIFLLSKSCLDTFAIKSKTTELIPELSRQLPSRRCRRYWNFPHTLGGLRALISAQWLATLPYTLALRVQRLFDNILVWSLKISPRQKSIYFSSNFFCIFKGCTLRYITFLKKWANPGLFLFYFHSFLVTISIQIEKSIDGVLGIRTPGRRMVGADETSELWRPPLSYITLRSICGQDPSIIFGWSVKHSNAPPL